MLPADDLELLHRYAREGCERSFAELVDRHLNLVYSAALRQVRSPELARDVSQSVFVELSRNASRLKPELSLTAWLYGVTRCRAIDMVRREARLHAREQIAAENQVMNSAAPDWARIEPMLDEAMDSLPPADRAAILLRYFEDRSFREVGEALGTSEAAAQRRISRAVERLRDFFENKRIPVVAAGLAAVISTNAVQAAPAGLGAAICASALAAGAGAATVTATAVTKIIIMTTLQKACIAAGLVATVGAGIFEASHASQLAGKIRDMEQTQRQLADHDAQSTKALDDANGKLAAMESENQQLRAQIKKLKADSNELGQMKAEDSAAANDPTQKAMLSWLDRVDQLKQRFSRLADQNIPEMKYLDEKDWLNAANAGLNTDKDYRRAMASVRDAAETAFLTQQLRPALTKFAAANNGQFPTNITQLQAYFSQPVDPSILERYTVEPASAVPNISVGGSTIITEKDAIDPDYDGRDVVGASGSGSMVSPGAYDAVPLNTLMMPMLKAYLSANNGQQPTDPSQLLPYATTAEQQAALRRVIQTRAAGN